MYRIEINELDDAGNFERRIGCLELQCSSRSTAEHDFDELAAALGSKYALAMTYTPATNNELVRTTGNY